MLESLLGEFVLSDVGLVELQALLKDLNKLLMGDSIVVPENVVVVNNLLLLA